MINLKETLFKIYLWIYDCLSNERYKLFGIIMIIEVFVWYITKNQGMFDELNSNFDSGPTNTTTENEEEGEILSPEDKIKNQNVNKTFNKYCKEIIDTHTEKINLYDNVVGYLVLMLGMLLIYYIYAGIFTYVVRP